MPISPWMKGATSPTWTIPMVRDNGTIMDLTGVTTNQLSLYIYNASSVQIGTGAGTFVIVNANPGIVRYHPAVADSATVGNNTVRVVVNFNGTDLDPSDYLAWVVQP